MLAARVRYRTLAAVFAITAPRQTARVVALWMMIDGEKEIKDG